ncbi:MAG: hypothetical protein GXO00_00590, partial [Candidatus Diapherotrites archaeon]|nr:hypothetical protein [Candidatus Diapherotrites archaeon]
MAKALDRLKDIFSRGKEEKEESSIEIDELVVDEIVKRVLEKYREEGTYIPDEEPVPESLKEIITVRTITSKTAPPLESHPSPFVRAVGNIYKKLKGVVDALAERLVNNRLMRKIDFDLYAANIRLTATQYVAIVLTLALVAA